MDFGKNIEQNDKKDSGNLSQQMIQDPRLNELKNQWSFFGEFNNDDAKKGFFLQKIFFDFC